MMYIFTGRPSCEQLAKVQDADRAKRCFNQFRNEGCHILRYGRIAYLVPNRAPYGNHNVCEGKES